MAQRRHGAHRLRFLACSQQQSAGIQVASLGSQPVSLNDQAARLATPAPQPAMVPTGNSALSFDADIVPVLPLIGPYIDDKPTILIGSLKGGKPAVSPFISSYASERVANANSTLQATNELLSPEAVSTAWKAMNKLPRRRCTDSRICRCRPLCRQGRGWPCDEGAFAAG